MNTVYTCTSTAMVYKNIATHQRCSESKLFFWRGDGVKMDIDPRFLHEIFEVLFASVSILILFFLFFSCDCFFVKIPFYLTWTFFFKILSKDPLPQINVLSSCSETKN